VNPHLPPYLAFKMTSTVRSLTLLGAATVAAGYKWPNPRMEAFDFLRWDQAGAHGGILGTGVVPCNILGAGPDPSNQTNAAQWLRTVSPLALVLFALDG
jgi:hypothetical protein